MGGMLSAYELMETANTIRASRILRQFIEAIVADEDIEIPHFIAKKDAIPILTGLEHEINAAIDDNGHVVDSASGTLRPIRQGLVFRKVVDASASARAPSGSALRRGRDPAGAVQHEGIVRLMLRRVEEGERGRGQVPLRAIGLAQVRMRARVSGIERPRVLERVDGLRPRVRSRGSTTPKRLL